MTTINVTIVDQLEIIILLPIFITFTILFYKSATSVLEFNKVASGMYSVGLSAVIMIGMKKHMMGIVLLPCAILGTVFFLIPMVSFIDRYKKTKKHKKRWSKYAAKRYWKDRLKTTLLKTLESIWDLVLMR